MKQVRGPNYWLLILALIAGLAGYFGPWVPHKAAGLVVTGIDLAEYVKFLPAVRNGVLQIQREIFYLPLFVASIAASLLAGRRTLSGWLRVLCGLAAIPLAMFMLPPAWRPSTLTEAEYQIQVLAIFICVILLFPGLLVTRYVPDRISLGLLGILCVAAAIAPFWGFLQIKPEIANLYRETLPIGWGAWLTLIAFLFAAVVCLEEALRRKPARHA
jgi:hypothetical protein